MFKSREGVLANTKSAKKDAIVNKEHRERNRSVKSFCRSSINKAEQIISEGNVEAARAAVGAAVSTLDRAAEKGIIHRNNAARRKSRLMKKINATGTPAANAKV
jgi:small subunit ribosomal protein S20